MGNVGGNGDVTVEKPKNWLAKFVSSDQGLETIEYAIMLTLIVAGLIVIVGSIGSMIEDAFERLQEDLGA